MNRIRQARRRLGLSQEELADAAGVSAATIVQVELGHRQPQGRTLRKLAAALGVEVADLLEEIPDPKVEASEPPDTFVDRLLRAPSMPIEEQSDEALQNYRENLRRARAGEPPAAYFEEERPDSLDFPPEQIEAWRAEQERENEWIRRELENMSKRELIELVLSTSTRLKEAYRKSAAGAPPSEAEGETA